jgi:hypothetical protein
MHNIQDRDSQTGVTQAWHGLTKVVESITRENSGIDYDMATVPLFIKTPDGQEVETPHRQIVSLDDNLPVGKPVSEGYSVISNSRIWDMIQDAMTGTDHKFVSAGTVADRAKGFISIQLDDSFVSAGRNTEPYLNLLWGHGGNIALHARTGFIVTVCENTFSANLGRKGKDLSLSIKHTRNAVDKIENMGSAIEAYCGVVAEFQKAMADLEATPCSVETAQKIFAGVLAPVSFERDEKVSTRTVNTVNRLGELFVSGRGNKGKDLSDVFNAATDYFTHESSGGDNRMKQFVSSEFGSGQEAKDTFYRILNDEDATERSVNRGEKVLLSLVN